MRNVYDTSDPEILLRLKRQEADALLDVLRSINHAQLKPEHILKIAKNTLLAQLGVKKILFVYRLNGEWVYGIRFGFEPLDEKAYQELPVSLHTTAVKKETHPALFGRGVEYIIPLPFQNNVSAFFLIADFADSEAEAQNDLIFIETIGNIISVVLENRELFKEMVRQESIRRELEVAETIQKQLLPSQFQQVGMGEVHAINIAHHRIGGDLYDIIPFGDDNCYICIADVSGKGIGAALLMANLQANLRALVNHIDSPVEIIEKLHQSLSPVTRGEKFVTLFLARLDLANRRIGYVNAGHNPPMLIRGDEILLLEKGTIPLGIMDLPLVEEGFTDIQPGDVLFFYTDGLTEQENEKGEMFGEQRLVEEIKSVREKSAEEIISRITESHRQFAGGEVQTDDVTMLAFRVVK